MKIPAPPSAVTGPLRDHLIALRTALTPLEGTAAFLTTSSDVTLTEDWYRVRMKATSTRTVYLPSATPFKGWTFQVKSVPESTATIWVQAASGQVIDGANVQSLITAGGSFTLQSYGTGWDIL